MPGQQSLRQRLALATAAVVASVSFLAAPLLPAGASGEATLPPGGNEYWFNRAGVMAERYHLGDTFVRQMTQESGFNDDVIYGRQVSWAGAEGIAQIMRSYHPTVDPLDPEEALDYAARHMLDLHTMFNGDTGKALAAYNAGALAVQEAVAARGDGWLSYLPEETQLYVATIMLPSDGRTLPGWQGIKGWWARLSDPVHLERLIDRAARTAGTPPPDMAAATDTRG